MNIDSMARRESRLMLTRDGILLGTKDDAERVFWYRVWDHRGVGEYPCARCTGLGRRTYGSTATWRGGIGGQAMTPDVCDECWGSGDAMRLGVNLKALEAQRP